MGKRDQSAPTRKARAAASDKGEVIFHGDVKEQEWEIAREEFTRS